MAERLALPLLPGPSLSKSLLQDRPNSHHLLSHQSPSLPPPSPPPPQPVSIKPLVEDVFHRNHKQKNPNFIPTQGPSTTNPALHLPRRRRPLGKHKDPNRGKPWSHTRLSSQGERIFQILTDLNFDSSKLDDILLKLFDNLEENEVGIDLVSVNADILGIIKGLGFYRKCDLALSVFNWICNRKEYEIFLDGPVVAVMISILGKEGRVPVAASLINMLEKVGFDVDVYAYTAMVSACASNGRYREAVAVFQKMGEVGCKPTLITFNVILSVYGKMGMPWIKITELVDDMKKAGIPPDLYTYNTLISCCRRGSLCEEAAQIFEEMKLAGFVPDKVTYNALLDVYGKSQRLKEAMEVLRDMEISGFAPSDVTYNSLISAYARNGHLEEAMKLKAQMVKKRIKPDVFTYTTLFAGFEKAGKDDCAMKVFEEMRSAGCKPNTCTFNALIKMHGNRRRFSEMMRTFEEMKNCDCSPDIVTWNSLLAVFGQNGMYTEVSGLFDEMKKVGFVPERDTFNILISAYSRCGSFDHSMAVYKMMLEAGVSPDLSTYNAVLAALARGGLWEQSEKVLAEMKHAHCKPNELTYSCLLHAYANGKEIGRMHAFAQKLYSGEIQLHAMLLKTLVLVNSKTDLLVETEQAFWELRKRGFPLDITTLNAMLSIYGRRQMVNKVDEILDFMKESQFTPTLTTYNTLMYMYSLSGSFERAEEVLKEIVVKGLKPDIISYNTVIYAYCRNDQLRDASRVFSEMRASGIMPDVITYNIFVASYAANAMFLKAIEMVHCMIHHGCRPNQNTYNSIVDFYCKLNRQYEASVFINSLHKLDPHLPRGEESRFKLLLLLRELQSVNAQVLALGFAINTDLRTENEDVQNVALVVGVTGISGNSLADILPLSDTPGGRWKVYGIARRPQPEWQFHHHIEYIQCEMVDPEDTHAKLSFLTDVTHIFYVGWVKKSSEAENAIENGQMLRNVLNAVIPNARNLQHICLQTGRKYHSLARRNSCLDVQHGPQFTEDLPRLDIPDCYYAMEDVLFEQVQQKENLTWSVHRPAIMFGFSPYSTRNIVGSLCVYATICKHEGVPLRFPGIQAAWEGYSEAADADLVAEQQIWAALEHPGKRQAFYCSNGEVFRWKDLWKILAEQFKVDFVGFEEAYDTLEEMMREKCPVWEQIIDEYELLPTKLEEVGTWWYVGSILRCESVLDSKISGSMDKSKEYDFWGSRNTEDSFRYWIERTKMYNIVPMFPDP